VDRLYTPWRLAYVKGEKQEEGCVFCNCQQRADEQEYILHRDRHWFVILNHYPYNGGHLLLVLNRHCGSLTECTGEEVADMSRLLKAMERALRDVYQPHGINCGYNGGAAAGAGIPGHFHVHMLPRWQADTNFITVIGDTRVIPETLDQTFASLRPALAAALAESGT